LSNKPELVALNKIDAIPKAALAKKKAALEKACGSEVHLISGVSGAGIDTVLRMVVKEIRKRRAPLAKIAKPVKAAKDKWTP